MCFPSDDTVQRLNMICSVAGGWSDRTTTTNITISIIPYHKVLVLPGREVDKDGAKIISRRSVRPPRLGQTSQMTRKMHEQPIAVHDITFGARNSLIVVSPRAQFQDRRKGRRTVRLYEDL